MEVFNGAGNGQFKNKFTTRQHIDLLSIAADIIIILNELNVSGDLFFPHCDKRRCRCFEIHSSWRLTRLESDLLIIRLRQKGLGEFQSAP